MLIRSPAGVRRSGRIRSATTTELTVDSNTNLSPDVATSDNDPKVSVMLPSGIAETRSIPAGGISVETDGTAKIDVILRSAKPLRLVRSFWCKYQIFSLSSSELFLLMNQKRVFMGLVQLLTTATIYDAIESETS